ncbi:hypothetical protein FUAX_50120 (plasmid) [Fulvitalea axinellae]|uniref:Uncharacterized protein n=2 Tax=Fulvitalea axinellae TaxID=1182444 RepID=A0AAU9DN12_9BACT|nr:hypothetical protein FUAX_50120 [Fulvitalea axinellae]
MAGKVSAVFAEKGFPLFRGVRSGIILYLLNVLCLMARQSGILKIEGKIDGISFYRKDGKYYARRSGGVSGARIRNDPRYRRTRENVAEFSEVARQGKLVRTAFRRELVGNASGNVTARLGSALYRVLKTDGVNRRGERKVSAGDLGLLAGFGFNANASVDTALAAPLGLAFDDSAEKVTWAGTVLPARDVVAPSGATHFRLRLAAASLDFDNAGQVSASATGPETAVDSLDEVAVALEAGYDKSLSGHTLALAGIEFLQAMNGELYPLSNGAYNAMGIAGYHSAV